MPEIAPCIEAELGGQNAGAEREARRLFAPLQRDSVGGAELCHAMLMQASLRINNDRTSSRRTSAMQDEREA